MYKLLGGLKDYFKHQEIQTDNAVFRLHNVFTTVLLLTCSLIITATQYVGQPISCIVNGWVEWSIRFNSPIEKKKLKNDRIDRERYIGHVFHGVDILNLQTSSFLSEHTQNRVSIAFNFWGKGRSSTEGRERKRAVHWINIWGSIYLLLWITKKLLFRGNSAKGEGERVWWWSAGHVMLLWMGPLNRAFVCLFYTTQDPEREEERERWSMDWLWGISLRFDFRIKSIHFFSTDRGVSTTSQSRTQSRETLLIHNTLTLFSFYIPEYQHMSSTPFAGSPARSQCRTPSRDR